MSDEALAPTLSNFDAIVAAKSAALEAKNEAPDTFENDDVSEVEPEDIEEVEEPEESAEDDAGDEEEPDEPEEDDPTEQPVETKLAAPFKAFRESIKSKRVTPELLQALGDLEMEVETVNGPVKMRVNEMAGHVMREARFSREMTKTKEVQAQSDRIIQIERARTNAWRQNPTELEHGLKVMGCGAALDALHMKWAQETHHFLSLPPQEQQRIQFERRVNAEREQEKIRIAQMERELQMRAQQLPPKVDEPTRAAGDYITQNLDRTLGAALKAANAGRINDDLRLAYVNELTELAEEGYPLEHAMREAAKTVATKQRRVRDLANGQAREVERKKKPEVSGKRAPAGGASPKRDGDGRFQAPSRSGSNGSSKRKGPPTAESFGERFGV